MWTFNADGFFSVVKDKYCSHDELMIRARNRSDLARMLARMAEIGNQKRPESIMVTNGADYRFRVKLKKAQWVAYACDTAQNIDYPSVKDHISGCDQNDEMHSKRRSFYYGVWHEACDFQESVK